MPSYAGKILAQDYANRMDSTNRAELIRRNNIAKGNSGDTLPFWDYVKQLLGGHWGGRAGLDAEAGAEAQGREWGGGPMPSVVESQDGTGTPTGPELDYTLPPPPITRGRLTGPGGAVYRAPVITRHGQDHYDPGDPRNIVNLLDYGQEGEGQYMPRPFRAAAHPGYQDITPGFYGHDVPVRDNVGFQDVTGRVDGPDASKFFSPSSIIRGGGELSRGLGIEPGVFPGGPVVPESQPPVTPTVDPNFVADPHVPDQVVDTGVDNQGNVRPEMPEYTGPLTGEYLKRYQAGPSGIAKFMPWLTDANREQNLLAAQHTASPEWRTSGNVGNINPAELPGARGLGTGAGNMTAISDLFNSARGAIPGGWTDRIKGLFGSGRPDDMPGYGSSMRNIGR